MSANTPTQFDVVGPEKIAFDKKNPRGETKEQIERDEEFHELRRSVRRHGVLVPVVVRRNGGPLQPFTLVDGERRLRAALAEKKGSIPVHIIEGQERDGRVLAYQIHMLRKQWDKRSELNSIREIIQELRTEQKDISDAELFKRLKEATSHKVHDLKTLLTLAEYDDATIRKVQDGTLAMSYLVQIDSSFISPLKRTLPEVYEEFGEANLRQVLARKAEEGKLGNTRYLMDHVLSHFRSPDKVKLENAIRKFLRNPDDHIEGVVKKMEVSRQVQKKGKKARKTKQKASARARKTTVPDQTDHRAGLVDIERQIIQDNVFSLVFTYMREAVVEFEKRTETKFANEPELQNFIYSVLRSLVASVEFEDPTEKICGKSNRLDFVLKDHKIIVEVKYVRDKTHARKVSEELAADYLRYKRSPYGQTIINYVYDPHKHIDNQDLYRKDLGRLMPDAHHYIQ